jgi:hypothetical protein
MDLPMPMRAALAIAALAFAAPAFAQDSQPGGQQGGQSPNPAMQQNREAVRKACATDIQTLCSNLPQGQRPGQCLREHEDKLSPDCKAAFDKARAAMQQHDQQPH